MQPPWDRRDTRAVLAIVALAFVVRLLYAAMSDVVGADAYAFVLGAHEMAAGDWATSLKAGIHPGYPLAIAFGGLVTGDLIRAGYLVSVVFSSLAMIPFYAMVRDMAGRRVAILATLLFACLHYFIREHGDIMTEGLFHFFFVTSAACAWFGAVRRTCTEFVFAGFTAAFAYVTRPEGIYLPFAIAGLAVMALIEARVRREPVPWRIAAFAALALAIFIFLTFPLFLYWHHLSGHWKLTHRDSADLVTTPGRATVAAVGSAFGKFWYTVLKTAFTFVLPLTLAGLVFARGRLRTMGAIWLVCLSLGYGIAPIVAAARGYALSHRYVLIPVLYFLPFAALGYTAVVDLLARRWNARRRVERIGGVVMGVMLLVLLVRAVHLREDPEVTIKEASLWLKDRGVGSAAVYANSQKPCCYLWRRILPVPKDEESVRNLSVPQGSFIIIDENRHDPAAVRVLEARFRRLAQFPQDGRTGVDRVSIFVP